MPRAEPADRTCGAGGVAAVRDKTTRTPGIWVCCCDCVSMHQPTAPTCTPCPRGMRQPSPRDTPSTIRRDMRQLSARTRHPLCPLCPSPSAGADPYGRRHGPNHRSHTPDSAATPVSRPHHVRITSTRSLKPHNSSYSQRGQNDEVRTPTNFTVTDVQRPVIGVDAYGSRFDIRKSWTGRPDQPVTRQQRTWARRHAGGTPRPSTSSRR